MTESVQVNKPNILVDGTMTVQLVNGRHFTYRIETVKYGGLKDRRIVSLLVGNDNEADYKGFGFVTDTGSIRIWTKQYTEAFVKHAALLMGNAQDKVICWLQASRCSRCHRLLSDPESIERGMGPRCAER